MKYFPWLLVPLLLFCILCGCSAPPAQSPEQTVLPPVDTGITDITTAAGLPFFNLSAALEDLTVYDSVTKMNVSERKIYHLKGVEVNEQGEAQIWVLGITRDSAKELMIYSDRDWRVVEWQGVLPAQEVDFSSVLTPDELYAQQSSLIKESLQEHNTTVSNLDLSDQIYTVTVTQGGSISVLTFDARTGELLLSA